MQEHTIFYVADEQLPARPAPPSEIGPVAAMRRNLFATPTDTILTLALAALSIWIIWGIIQWGFVNATFSGSGGEACREGEHGACWIFIGSRFEQFIYGNYPQGERWRVNLVVVIFTLLAAAVAIPKVPYKAISATLLAGVFPIFAYIMLTGGALGVSGGTLAFFMLFGALISIMFFAEDAGGLDSRTVRFAFIAIAIGYVVLLVSNFTSLGNFGLLGLRFTPFSAIACVAALATGVLLALGMRRSPESSGWKAILPVLIAGLVILMVSESYGLRPVSTTIWGGLMLTLVVAITGIALSLPLGIILALGRQQETMPAIRWICIAFIEFWRGVPLITVLFMAAFMLPLLVPTGVSFNQLLRALIGVALFAAAYMAEVVRGGLQAIPKGQYEGARSLGLGYWPMMRLIILPQALKLVIPGIVNTFIGLFKDTSLVYIIGLADLLGTVQRGTRDPNWIAPSTAATAYVFAAFVFWLFCFGMSRYSQFVERQLQTGHKR